MSWGEVENWSLQTDRELSDSRGRVLGSIDEMSPSLQIRSSVLDVVRAISAREPLFIVVPCV